MESSERGFTLIEILMVILLVGIISGVAIPQFIDFRSDAKAAVTKNRMNELRMAIVGDPRQVANGQYVNAGFLNHVGSVPTSLNDLTAQGTFQAYDPFAKRGWRGPYVSTAETNWNRDAWGTLFQYTAATRTIRSCGPNLTCGNADDITVTF